MRLSIRLAVSVFAVLTVVGLTQFTSTNVEAQRVVAVPRVTNPAPAQDLQTLLKRIERLEKRVDDLEKGALAFVNKAEDDAKDAVLKERLAALEKSRSGENASGRSPSSAGGITRVQAPFEVVTADGRRVARIDGDNGGGLFLYNRGGSRIVHIGPNDVAADSGHVSVFASQGDKQQSFYASSNGGGVLFLRNTGGSAGIVLNADQLELNIHNLTATPVVTLKSMTGGSGRIEVADASGNNMVQAGVTTNGVGLVRAGPAGCQTVGALAQPCRIIGTK